MTPTPGPAAARGKPRLPSTEGLRAFEVVARRGSFERAALELNLTASAVRKRVDALEQVAGLALFVRKPNALTLTEPGSRYLEAVREVLRLLVALPGCAQPAEAYGRLRISSTPTFARQLLAPNLAAFASLHAGIEVELVLIPPEIDYPATAADVEIRAGDAAAHGGVPLMQDFVTPMAAPGLLAQLAPLRTPADLLQAPLLRTQHEPWLPWFRAALLDWPEPSAGPRLQDLGLTFEAAARGQGIALCRPGMVREWLASDTLRPLFDIFARSVNQYYALVNLHHRPAQLFVRWLQELCAGQADAGHALVRRSLALRQRGDQAG